MSGSAGSQADAAQELVTAKWVWSLLRGTVEKLAMAGGDQIEDPEIDECFDWDPSYLMLDWCEAVGWVPGELRAFLDQIDSMLTRLSADPRLWSDAAIVGDPLWERVRLVIAGRPSINAGRTVRSWRIATKASDRIDRLTGPLHRTSPLWSRGHRVRW
ncbi:MAG TPA: hypothetical protein VF834_03165 [Streptosporangiaceae bacterium]